MANTAVAAVKKGCQLYKDVKSAAGNVQEILDDLHGQFAGKKLSKAQVAQYEKEKERVKEIAKANPNDVLGELGQHLGTFFDMVDQVEALFYEEEKKAKEVYRGNDSPSRRALQRVMIRSRLESLHVEMREMMIYQTPPELKDLWTRFEQMRAQIGVEQAAARKEEERLETIARYKRSLLIAKWQSRALYIAAVLIMVLEIWGLLITMAMTRRS
ncbi:MAG: hypothetical protein EBU96_01290 [Actinobacteria bacterium]|nr:hypothetical protein [Actinomycetota bacterium]